MKVNINAPLVLRVGLIACAIALGWYFSSLLLYLFLAFVFSLVGRPVAHRIAALRIGKLRISYGAGTAITMLLMVAVFGVVLLVIIPPLVSEAEALSHINYNDLVVSINYLVENVQQFLHRNGIMNRQDTLVQLLVDEAKNFVSLTSFSNIVGGLLSATGSFLFALFCILFFTAFFIRDNFNISSVAFALLGRRYTQHITDTTGKINHLLSRYFIGLFIEIVAMISLIYIGLLIFGIKGALLFAVFGGILNIVPYLGPMIGTIACCLFGIINCVTGNDYTAIMPTVIRIIGVFVGANLLDNLLLQPLIYSQSLKIHPVEIFIIIIMGGSLGGIIGMIVAIPVYTIVRTIVVELVLFMNHSEKQTLTTQEQQDV